MEQIMDPNEKLRQTISQFKKSYDVMSEGEKIKFENQIIDLTRTMDERTRRLYDALISAVKLGLNIDEAVCELQKVDEEFKRKKIFYPG